MSVVEAARVGFWDGMFIPPTPRSPATVVVAEETPQLDYLAQGIADITQGHDVPLEDAASLVGAYLARLDERTQDLREALEGWRGAEAADIAHSIIEAARAFEADEVMAACASIEKVAGLGPCSVTMSTIGRLERANQDLRATLSAA